MTQQCIVNQNTIENLIGAPLVMTARGDTQTWGGPLLDAEGHAFSEAPTAVFFTVKNNFDDEDYVLQKQLGNGITIDNGLLTLSLTPEDTNGLPFGEYVYDLEIILQSGNTQTVHTLAKNTFLVTAESTYASNQGDA